MELYDSIDMLPVARFHKYQKLLLIDAGVGSDIAGFDQRTEKIRRYMMDGKADKALMELDNLRQCVYMVQTELSPKNRAFAALVTKVDGEACDDLSDEALQRVTDLFGDVPQTELTARLGAVKKKIDGELRLYFPGVFADSEVKEYFDILKKRTLAVLDGIVNGISNPDGTDEVERLTTQLITYTAPQPFSGSESLEIQFDRQYEDLCLVLSEQLHVNPKTYTVLEFYNAFDFVNRRAKKEQRKQKRNG